MNNEIEKVWRDYWVPILFNREANGMDVEKLKEELYNYYINSKEEKTCEQPIRSRDWTYHNITWGAAT